MTDSPLDCRGISLTAQVGKHDFRRIPLTEGYQPDPSAPQSDLNAVLKLGHSSAMNPPFVAPNSDAIRSLESPHLPTKCHLCDDHAIAVFYFSHGCYCNRSTVQPLCLHHAHRSGPPDGGSKELIKDLTINAAFTKNWIRQFVDPLPAECLTDSLPQP